MGIIIVAVIVFVIYKALGSNDNGNGAEGSLTVGEPHFGGASADRPEKEMGDNMYVNKRGFLVTRGEYRGPCGCMYRDSADGGHDRVKGKWCDDCRKEEEAFQAQQRARGR